MKSNLFSEERTMRVIESSHPTLLHNLFNVEVISSVSIFNLHCPEYELGRIYSISQLDTWASLPGSSDGKEPTCNEGEGGGLGSIPGLGRSPGGGHGNPLQYSCLENPRGQRSLVGCSPWGGKESGTTERPRSHAYTT